VLTKREAEERQRQAERTQNPVPKAGTCREIFRVYANKNAPALIPSTPSEREVHQEIHPDTQEKRQT
jgi:hypothetical protein